MFKILATVVLSMSIGACSPEKSVQLAPATQPQKEVSKTEIDKKGRAVEKEVASRNQSTDQVKSIAKSYGVSETKVHDTASGAAGLSGGNASKQDMLDALMAARGE